MLVKEALAQFETLREKSADVQSARLDVECLLAHVLNKSRTYLRTWPEHSLSATEQSQFQSLLARRLEGEPVAYLVGEREFWRLSLQVNPSTLIPRPETELLVEMALELNLPKHSRILDLGTGTGAIALALAQEHPQWQVTGVDRVPEAIKLAKQNAHRNALMQVEFSVSNWFQNLPKQILYDLIVSNPPYIDADDPHLDKGDVRFEPHSALVSGDHGLADIALIVNQSRDFLAHGGYLLLEHGYEQGDQVRNLLSSANFDQVASHKDLAGHERVTGGRWHG